MMMCLGLFVFSLDTAAYQEMQRQTEWKFPSTSRVGTRDSYQYAGPGEDSITLSGWIAPELTGTALSLDALRMMADTGKSWVMVQGTGRILGTWIITSMHEGRTILDADGDARRIEFSITLKRTDESLASMLKNMGNLGDMNNLADMMGLTSIANSAKDLASAIGNLPSQLPTLP